MLERYLQNVMLNIRIYVKYDLDEFCKVFSGMNLVQNVRSLVYSFIFIYDFMIFVLNDYLVLLVLLCVLIFDFVIKICKIVFCVKKKVELELSCFIILGISIFLIIVL